MNSMLGLTSLDISIVMSREHLEIIVYVANYLYNFWKGIYSD
jgi:sulfur relay (sulfurtransferase) DsrC/TusE family protein